MSTQVAAPAPLLLRRAGRARAHLSVPLYRNAYALLVNTGITSVLGLGYWAVAAHHYPAATIGRASSAISALQLLSGIAQCNLNNTLPRLLPTAGDRTAGLVVRAYATAVGLSLLLGGAFAAVAVRTGWAGGFLGQGDGYVAWFVVAVAVWSVFFLEDGVLAGLRQAVWVPVENTSFSVAKIVMLVALAGATVRFGVFGSFTIPVAVAVVPVNWLIFRRLIPRHVAAPLQPGGVVAGPGLRRYLAGEYTGGLANLATTTMLPLLVASEIGTVANAWFYSAWVVGSAFEYVLSAITVSLVVEGANAERATAWVARRGLAITTAVVVPSVALTVIAAPTVLSILGSGYARHGTVILRLVALGVAPRSVITLCVANARIRKDIRGLLGIQVTGCVTTLGLAVVLLPRLGLAGAGVAYVVAQTAVALGCLPRLVRTLHHPGTAVAPDGAAPSQGHRVSTRSAPAPATPTPIPVPPTPIPPTPLTPSTTTASATTASAPTGSISTGSTSTGSTITAPATSSSTALLDRPGTGRADTGETDLEPEGPGPGRRGHARPPLDPPGDAVRRVADRSGRPRRPDPLVVASLLLALTLAELTTAGTALAVQPVLAAAFFLWVPGAAATGMCAVADGLVRAVLSVASSIAIGMLTAEAMLWTGFWHPRDAVVTLALASAVVLAYQLLRPWRAPAGRHVRVDPDTGEVEADDPDDGIGGRWHPSGPWTPSPEPTDAAGTDAAGTDPAGTDPAGTDRSGTRAAASGAVRTRRRHGRRRHRHTDPTPGGPS